MQKPVIDLDEVKKELSRRTQFNFTKYTMPKKKDGTSKFHEGQFHKSYYSVLDYFVDGQIKKLIITVPPQHGKSEGSTRRLPARMIGNNSDLMIAIASYASTQARRFGRDINRIIDSKEYIEIYPDVKLSKSKLHNVQSEAIRTSEEFEIINNDGLATGGNIKLVGRKTALTGNPVDILVIDDLYKNAEEGNSPVIRNNCIEWYDSTAESRLHNDSQQLIVFTRWHEDDLIGYLEKKEEVKILKSLKDIDSNFKGWYKINYQAIKEDEPSELDPREKGQALWPERHSLEKLQATRKRNNEKFECMYQGNPESAEGFLYKSLQTYSSLPIPKKILNYTDTADTGQDYLCSINYIQGMDDNLYITDIVYTQEDMDKTKGYVISLLERGQVNTAMIESNNGGRLFASDIKEKLKGRSVVKWFHQSGNKESRIFSNSDMVQENILFPADWASRWPEFYGHVTRFKKVFKANAHDDAVDCLTGIIEQQAPNQKGRRKLILPDGRVV